MNQEIVWKLVCSFLVYFMQIGFLLIESGSVSKKNNSSVAFKNIVDFFVCLTTFTFWGFWIYWGSSILGLTGDPFQARDLLSLSMDDLANFLYLSGFASATCTIVSGTIGESVNSKFYIYLTFIISALCYPFISHWVWNSEGYLATLGFVDFAGSAVVHTVGGLAALITTIIIGPKKLDSNGERVKQSPSNNVDIVFGGFILTLCWIGFNGGSISIASGKVPLVIVNTLIAAAGGFLSCLLIEYFWSSSKFTNIPIIVNGFLGGLVAITACAHLTTPSEAFLVGLFAGILMYYVTNLLEKRDISDVVGAIPVHFACGVFGILIIPIFNSNTFLSFIKSLGIQTFGITLIILYTVMIIILAIKIFQTRFPIRVSAEEEEEGLNYTEFGIRDELTYFFNEIEQQVETSDFTKKLYEEPYTLVGRIAKKYNWVTDEIVKLMNNEKEHLNKMSHLSTLAATGEMASGIAHEINNPLAIIRVTNAAFRKILTKKNIEEPILYEFLTDVDNTIDRISRIIQGMRTLTRDTTNLEIESFTLEDILNDIDGLVRSAMNEKRIEFVKNIDVSLLDFKIEFNRTQLSQVLINTINNAIHAVEDKTETKWIEINAINSDTGLEINIIDCGSDIPPEVTDKMFNPFFTTKDVGKGTGIGLSLSKTIMKNHGGDLTYIRDAKNTTFRIRINES